MTRLALAGLVLLTALSGCSDDPYEGYCDTVVEQREPLSEIVDAGGPGAFIEALPRLRALRDDAPADIRDDWQQIVSSVEGLRDALGAAGADPATYDRADPPEGVTPAEQDRIDAAAGRLNGIETRTAFASVQQQARDVCRTPLLLV